MNEPVIRTAIADDLAVLLDLYEQLSGDPVRPEPGAAAAALAALLSLPGASLLVAEVDGIVVGTVTILIVPSLGHRARPWAQLENMVVDEARRGSGAGHALIEECFRRAREAGCYKVQLESNNTRTGAHRFYEREGFTNSAKGFRQYFDG